MIAYFAPWIGSPCRSFAPRPGTRSPSPARRPPRAPWRPAWSASVQTFHRSPVPLLLHTTASPRARQPAHAFPTLAHERASMRRDNRPRIYFSLLALCYLEIVLWTACLLFTAQGSALPAEAAAGHTYLRRETGNLKAFAGGRQQQLAALAFDELAFELERIQQREQLTLQAQSRADRDEPSRLPSQPPPLSLRAFPAVQGLPAPFTGIQAID